MAGFDSGGKNDREPPATYGTIAMGDSMRAANTPDELWEQLPALERGIRRALRRAGPEPEYRDKLKPL